MRFRLLSGLLSIGGCLWGLFCLYFIILGNTAYTLLLFGPGYVITFGYIVRAVGSPSVTFKRLIWGTSAILQGSWLAWGTYLLIHDGLRSIVFDFVTTGWWGFAFFASAYGLAFDVSVDPLPTRLDKDSTGQFFDAERRQLDKK
jgi:hypothetical protein